MVIGPNAKVATYHGGGSASLAAYYAVTPFDGISAKLPSPPEYSIGAYSHKMLPLLGHVLKTKTGHPGMTMKVFNEAPGEDKREETDSLDLVKTEMLLVDYYNPKLKSDLWYADFEGSFEADEDTTWELGLVVCGTAKLFVNGELVIDNASVQRQGDAFFGSSTVEEKGFIKVNKGGTYNVKVEFASAPTSKLAGNNVLFGGGTLRVGGCKVIDTQEEIARAAELAREADQVVICAGLNADWESEGADRAGMDLPPHMDEMISAVAAANTNTVVVMQSGTPVHMPWVKEVPAIVQAWYGGNETGNVIADILFGDVNPSGKLSLSFPIRFQDNPAYFNYRAEAGRTLYGEDVYMGYRYYEYVERDVLFPFGHGLSYTEFQFSDISIKEESGKLAVEVVVKNVGSARGAEVAQVYVAPKQPAKVNRPRKELKGFAKVELDPGESRKVAVEIESKYAVSYWAEERKKWCGERGDYEVIVSNSSEVKEGKAVKGQFSIPETFYWDGL